MFAAPGAVTHDSFGIKHVGSSSFKNVCQPLQHVALDHLVSEMFVSHCSVLRAASPRQRMD